VVLAYESQRRRQKVQQTISECGLNAQVSNTFGCRMKVANPKPEVLKKDDIILFVQDTPIPVAVVTDAMQAVLDQRDVNHEEIIVNVDLLFMDAGKTHGEHIHTSSWTRLIDLFGLVYQTISRIMSSTMKRAGP
jgi:hypothetical protein